MRHAVHDEESPRRLWMHGWGDLRTWLIIGGLIVALLVTSAIIYFAVGNGMRTGWSLGQPPTGPN